MAYAIIDYHDSKWFYPIKQINYVGELDIFLPHFKEKTSQKYGKKVLNILNKAEINKLVISNDILKNRAFCDVLYENKKSIITGRNMYKSLVVRILKDIASQMKAEIKKLKVVMLIEDYSVENIDLIKAVSKEVKSLTVVTTDKDKFDMLVSNLYENYGIVLKVVEKNTTEFKVADVLLNVDFPSYDMNKVNVPNDALIICGFAKNYEKKANFNGIIVKNIDVVDVTNRNSNINDLSLCEAKIYSYLRKLKENDRVFEREGFKINGYFGENGKIRTEEFMELGKKLS
ncbi:MAG: hypothetical protein IJ220_09280 [Clostridia bacterium]|nr:hypothetical protein [Clostridia bacterium]